MSALLTATQVKQRLRLDETDDAYDELLTLYLPIVTEWFEAYCGRGLARRTIVGESYSGVCAHRLPVWAFPLITLTSVELDGEVIPGSYYRIDADAGYFMPDTSRPYYETAELMKVSYVGGYEDTAVPADLALAFSLAVGAECGIASPSQNSGAGSNAIKQIGLGGGALQVAFDTSRQVGGITGAFDVSRLPPEVQQYAGVLDRYRRWGV